jgi:hypothetical protein
MFLWLVLSKGCPTDYQWSAARKRGCVCGLETFDFIIPSLPTRDPLMLLLAGVALVVVALLLVSSQHVAQRKSIHWYVEIGVAVLSYSVVRGSLKLFSNRSRHVGVGWSLKCSSPNPVGDEVRCLIRSVRLSILVPLVR